MRRAAPRGRHRLSFVVTDSGIGLSKAEIARLFRPFRQANADIARRFGGSGLGLAFARRLAKAMGGDLTVKSRAGQGSTFTFSVTLAEAPTGAPSVGVSADGKRAASTRTLRVLCAEDNPYARVVLNTILTELGHRVDFAGTGEAAVAAVERGGYDLVLMDVTLPGHGRPCGGACDPRAQWCRPRAFRSSASPGAPTRATRKPRWRRA